MFSQGRLGAKAVVAGSRLLTETIKSSEMTSQAIRLRGLVAPVVSVVHSRNFHSVKYSWKFEYYSAADVRLPKKMSEISQALEGQSPRPLTILPTWLGAKDKHIRKYVTLYNNLGIDVLNIRFTLLDILNPKTHAQRVVDKFLNFMHYYPTNIPLIVHGFSVGGYVIAAAMVEMERDYETHGPMQDRFVGQIWDSVVDVAGLPIGCAKALTDIVPVQNVVQGSLEAYLRYRYESATAFYNRASVVFHKNYLETPGLFLTSRKDNIAPPEMVLKAHDNWKELGYPVFSKVWKDTGHVNHYGKHRKEYEAHVISFLKEIGLSLPYRTSVVPVKGRVESFTTPQTTPILTLNR